MLIIGDVHGNFDTLMALLDKIPEEEKQKGICFVGDLIDRGPKSKQVVQWVIDAQKDPNQNIDCVAGNHEVLMSDNALAMAEFFVKNGKYHYGGMYSPNLWMVNGGDKTFDSYITDLGNDEAEFQLSKMTEHVEWMKNLPTYLEYKDVKNDKGEHLLVTHSSATKVWKWSKEHRAVNADLFRNHLIWGRPRDIRPIPNVYNIFGHTPVSNGPRVKSCYANVDTGCFYNGEPGYFQLTALKFPEMTIYQQECIDTPVYSG